MTTSNAISIGLIETCFSSQHVPYLFSGKETNEPALRLIAQMVHYTRDPDFVFRVVQSALPPDYAGNTLEEVPGMLQRALNKEFDRRETGGRQKPSIAVVLLDLVHQLEGLKLFHDPLGKTYISYQEPGAGQTTLSLTSSSAQALLRRLYYKKTGKPIPAQSFREAHETLQAEAMFDSPEEKIYLRVARHGNSIIVNLADKDRTVVVINEDDYEVTTESPVSFVKSASMAALPVPEANSAFQWEDFRKLLGVSQDIFDRIIAFAVNCLKPEGPYLFLLTQGEQGSGKSLLSELVKKMVDPSNVPKLRLPGKEQDLMIQAKDNHILVFDNVSGIKANMSDALCCLSTGGGLSTRKLYSDDESQVFSESRPYVLNGITGIANRPDLLERSLSLSLPSIGPGKRKTEAEIHERFNQMHPFILDKLFKGISFALGNFAKIEAPTTLRMADAAKWLIAAEEGLGFPEGRLLKALEDSQREITVDTVSKNSLALALAKSVEKSEFRGTVGELCNTLSHFRVPNDHNFPTTPAHLSAQLERLRPALAMVGINVRLMEKSRKGRQVHVWLTDEEILESAPEFNGGFKPKIET